VKAARWAFLGGWAGLAVVIAVVAWQGVDRPGPAAVAGLDVLYLDARTPADIVPLSGPEIPPLAYRHAPSLAGLDPEVRKQKFADLLVPAILISRAKLRQQRQELERILAAADPTPREERWVETLRQRYRAPDLEALRRRLRGHPTSVVLAQAALESGWGTSRFFTAANNVFGTWSFDRDEPRVAARGGRDGVRPHLKRYASLAEAVDDYFLTIGRGPYLEFRLARLESEDPDALVPHLANYSELRDVYTARVMAVIDGAGLRRYDAYRLAPEATR